MSVQTDVDQVRVFIEDHIATVVINRPERSNALDAATNAALHHVFRTLSEDPAVWTIILTAAGEHLADTLSAVVRGPGPLVVGGSVLTRTGPVRDAFLSRLGPIADGLEIRSVGDGAVGAAVLAVRAAGGEPDDTVLERLTQTLARFR